MYFSLAFRFISLFSWFLIIHLCVVIFENTRVTNTKDDEPCLVQCGQNASIRCRHIVMATHTPIGVHVTMHTAVYPMRSYVMAVRVANTTPVPQGLFWDTAEVCV